MDTQANNAAAATQPTSTSGPAAGVATSKLNTDYKLQLKLISENKREFQVQNETDRSMKMKSIMKKDHQYYNLSDNLWNESTFLRP